MPFSRYLPAALLLAVAAPAAAQSTAPVEVPYVATAYTAHRL